MDKNSSIYFPKHKDISNDQLYLIFFLRSGFKHILRLLMPIFYTCDVIYYFKFIWKNIAWSFYKSKLYVMYDDILEVFTLIFTYLKSAYASWKLSKPITIFLIKFCVYVQIHNSSCKTKFLYLLCKYGNFGII